MKNLVNHIGLFILLVCSFSFASPKNQVLNDSLNFGTSDFTVSFTIRTESHDTSYIVGKREICGVSSFWNIFLTQGKLVLEMYNEGDSSSGVNFESISRVNDGQWHEVKFMRYGSKLLVFVDQRLESEQIFSVHHSLVNHAPIEVGVNVCTGVQGTVVFAGELNNIDIQRN